MSVLAPLQTVVVEQCQTLPGLADVRLVKANGFLFIGDPHVTSLKPGRRKDDFVASVLGKLSIAAEIARRENLVPVILGDLFHRAGENHLPTITRLTRVLKDFHVVPWCLGGNHDKEKKQLSDVDALQFLDLVGVLKVIDGDCREALVVEAPAGRIALWFAPYGAKLPVKIESDADQVVLIAHHDLAFEGKYPGATELFEIPGCDLVVNGHMHKTAPSVRKGQTHWHCPGNIEPLSIDCIDHIPAVWAWTGEDASNFLQRIVLPHVRDCFDLTGLAVAPSATSEAVAALEIPALVPATGKSKFAELMSATATMEATRTEDDETFIEDLLQGLNEVEACGPVQSLLLAIARKAPLPVIAIRKEPEQEEIAA